MMIVYCPRPFNQGDKQGEDFCIKSRKFQEFIRKNKLWKCSWYKCTVEKQKLMGACVGKTEQPKSTDKTELPKASGQKLNANKEPQRSANPEQQNVEKQKQKQKAVVDPNGISSIDLPPVLPEQSVKYPAKKK